LISKKNIRYEGLLYSINEQNATVALQNVRSFGTEGRDANDPETDFVAATEQVHPFLLFRGQDIKDLHVHENQDASPAEAGAAPKAPEKTSQDPPPLASEPTAPAPAPKAPAPPKAPQQQQQQHQSKPKPPQQQKSGGNVSNTNNRRPRSSNNNKQGSGGGGAAVGTGASLLNRKARGVVVDGHSEEDAKVDFDFESHNQQFAKEVAEDEEAGDEPVDAGAVGAYEKDDFFDSISCDTIDKQSGVDNRLRGREERQLNTETFGAVALNNNRRRGGGRGGRGRGGGRGGRGGRGRGGGRRSNNWNSRSSNTSNNASSAPGGQQARYSAKD